MAAGHKQAPALIIIYDGECPICSQLVKGLRLKQAAGSLQLIDARHHAEERLQLKRDGMDLNAGMVVKLDQAIYYADEAMQILTLMTTASGPFNRWIFLLLRSPARAALFYPGLVRMRLLLLRLLGRKPI